jgi:alpha-amylase/alpha-mannosidase (GH57 family)
MSVALAVHGHFYQPPRENPWTEEVPVEPSAAPYHDWNSRIEAECYRPNAFARIVDDHGLVVAIVNNYELLSFNIGPTLAAWLERHAPVTYARILQADRERHTALAQPYHHTILPLASPRDLRTQIRWGLADFAHRFGRPAEGVWLPEAAVNDDVLAALVEEGVRFTILGPHQAVEPPPPGEAGWWPHPDGSGRGLAVVFFDGPLSHDVAFGLATSSAQALVDRAVAAAPAGGLVVVATDGETFGHHQPYTERAIAYALAVEAPARGAATPSIAAWLAEHPPTRTVQVRESAWSCAHGVGRWKEDCGCSARSNPRPSSPSTAGRVPTSSKP